MPTNYILCRIYLIPGLGELIAKQLILLVVKCQEIVNQSFKLSKVLLWFFSQQILYKNCQQ